MASQLYKTKFGPLPLTIEQLNKLEIVKTPYITIAGVPWTISIVKVIEKETSEKFIWMYLTCEKMHTKRSSWLFGAAATFKVISHSIEDYAFEVFLPPYIYNPETNSTGIELSKWDYLFHVKNDYVEDNSITVEATITTNNLIGMDIEWRAMFKWTLKDPRVMFEMEIANIDDLLIVRSSKFLITEIPFVIEVVRGRRFSDESEEPDDYLSVYQRCIYDNENSNWTCKTRLSVTLLTNNDGTPKLATNSKYDKFNCYNMRWGYSQIISWQDLKEPTNDFVKHNHIISLRIKIEIQ